MFKKISKFLTVFTLVAVLLVAVPMSYAAPGARGDYNRVNVIRTIAAGAFVLLPTQLRLHIIAANPDMLSFRIFGSLDSIRGPGDED